MLVVDNELGNYPVERCLIAEARKIRFPPPGGDKASDFEYTMEFRSPRQKYVVIWRRGTLRRPIAAKLGSLGRCGSPGEQPVQAVAYIKPNGWVASVGLASEGRMETGPAKCMVDQNHALAPARQPRSRGAHQLRGECPGQGVGHGADSADETRPPPRAGELRSARPPPDLEGVPATDTSTAQLVARALLLQRVATARRLATLRLVGVAAALVLCLIMAYGVGLEDWLGSAAVFAVYAGCSFGLWGVLRASDRAAGWAGLAVALVDVPMVVWSQWISLPLSPSPGGVAGFTLGILVLLLGLAALSLSVGQTWLVAAIAGGAEVLLQHRVGIRFGAWIAALLVLGCAAGRAHLPGQPGAGAGGRRHRRGAEAGPPAPLLLPVGGRAAAGPGRRLERRAPHP